MDTMNPKPMKNLLPLFLLFATSFALAQQQEQPMDSIDQAIKNYLERKPLYYNPSFCGCPSPKKDTTTVKKDSLKLPPITFYRHKKTAKNDGFEVSVGFDEVNTTLSTPTLS